MMQVALELMADGVQMEEVTNFLVDVMSEGELIAFATNLGTAWVSYQQQQGVPVAAISAAMATETGDGSSDLDPGSAEGIMASPQCTAPPSGR